MFSCRRTKKFSKVEGSSRTVTVGVAIDATVDDQIYATVVDYDLWEYPVYGDNRIQGHVLVVDPQIVKNSWFDSKSWKGYSYIPNHEVGNILSYRRYPMLSDNPLMVEKVKGDYGLETSVFNAMGQQIATLADGDMIEGIHVLEFDGMNHAPGIYFCTIMTGGSSRVVKMVLRE